MVFFIVSVVHMDSFKNNFTKFMLLNRHIVEQKDIISL